MGGRTGHLLVVVDVFLRSMITAVLALGITGAALYEVIALGRFQSPVVNWAGIIVGVYFGSVVASRGEERRRRLDVPNGNDA